MPSLPARSTVPHAYGRAKQGLDATMAACILLPGLKLIALDGDLAKAEPKTLRILHAAADRMESLVTAL
jgi:hypothetical protein